MNNKINNALLLALCTLSTGLYIGCNNSRQQNDTTSAAQDTIPQKVSESLAGDSLSHQDIGFGLFDDSRKQLILIDDEERPSNVKELSYVWANEKAYQFDFVKMQQESEDYNGRQTPDNFSNLPGAVFQLHEKTSPGEAYAFLANDSFHKTRKAVAVKQNLVDAHKSNVITELKKSYQSPIKTIKLIATTAEKDSIFLAQLAPLADTLTVLLVAKSNTSPTLFIQEFKAEYNEMSTWRVDDGGQFPMEDFTILNVFRYNNKIELVTSFPGPEGGSFSFITPDKQNRYRTLKEAYAYWSPL
ncbi:hypothetical protein [Sphingobacterium faecale]|uniref:Lipoprotein n=1 Tax=Sphingobacterium faecale TaxID=2803775 RepID=A0ABS1R9D5_9SPHI|nr:hypothetical protein [Sphingobacterium faecale]MBL1411316.1 hypothetical protein [Sphingobacterium faecale]